MRKIMIWVYNMRGCYEPMMKTRIDGLYELIPSSIFDLESSYDGDVQREFSS